MDRQIVYPGSIPLDTDVLSIQRDAMIAIGYLAQATLGSTTLVDGLACLPTSPASLTVSIGPGSITALGVVDAMSFGSMGQDTTDPLLRMGVNTVATSFTLTAPTTSGQAINYLIQASFVEADGSPIVLPYYNAANPSQPFYGPSNNGVGQNTQRTQRVQFQLKPSAPANAGSQVTPTIDSGWVGLYVITINYGQSQIQPQNIITLPTAPFINYKLNVLTPGFSRIATFITSTNFQVPNGVALLRVRLSGGGGGGGAGTPTFGGGGGGAGGYAEGIIPVTPGQVFAVVVAQGGTAGLAGGTPAGVGGSSSFGTIMSASGGFGGASGSTYAFGGSPGAGAGGAINISGGYGSDGNGGNFVFAGNGGASFFGGGGRAAASSSAVQQIAEAPGSGGGGCYGVQGNGGPGAAGLVVVEF